MWHHSREQCVCVCVCISQSCLTLLWPYGLYETCQAPLSMGFSKQEYWSGLAFLSLGNLPNPGIKPWSPTLAGRFSSIWATRDVREQCSYRVRAALGARSSGLGKAFGIWRLKPQAWLFDWRQVTQLLWICFSIHKMGIIMSLKYLQVIRKHQFFEALLHGTLRGAITLVASFILLLFFFVCLF